MTSLLGRRRAIDLFFLTTIFSSHIVTHFCCGVDFEGLVVAVISSHATECLTYAVIF